MIKKYFDKNDPATPEWIVEYSDEFKKQFAELPEATRAEITTIINKLKKDPIKYMKERPEQFEKL